jgi:hypothetical protein
LRSPAAAAALAIAIAACSRVSREEKAAPDPPPGPSPQSSPAIPRSTLALGERVTSPLVPLTEIAKSPARFENQLVATSGRVTAVCQEMGCWMEIEDESSQAHVKMHGHSFFVPKTAAGHVARIQAKVLRQRDQACNDQRMASAPQVELDATGVELE